MKYTVLSFALMISTLTYSQTTDSASNGPVTGNKTFQVVEHMPEFPGGEAAMIKFIKSQIRYPKIARRNNLQGRVVVGFVVMEDGSLTDIVIKKSVSEDIDAEAIRVVNLLPKFIPGSDKGKAVRVAFVLPIKFALN